MGLEKVWRMVGWVKPVHRDRWRVGKERGRDDGVECLLVDGCEWAECVNARGMS